MSIQSQITRIYNNVQNTLTIIREAGLTVASDANSDSLPDLVDELANDFDGGAFVNLPDGYTHVEYVESDGASYFDTGFKPNSDTHIVMDAQMTSSATSQFVYGCRTASYTNNFIMLISGTNNGFRNGYGSSLLSFSSMTLTGRYVFEQNKNIGLVGNSTVTNTVQTFSTTLAMYLAAANEGGTAKYFSKMKIYNCKIYDNGTLVRQYFPCINPSGVVGLYDMVNGAFNSGVGTFTAGRAVVL